LQYSGTCNHIGGDQCFEETCYWHLHVKTTSALKVEAVCSSFISKFGGTYYLHFQGIITTLKDGSSMFFFYISALENILPVP
jgi:hypothetical protein